MKLILRGLLACFRPFRALPQGIDVSNTTGDHEGGVSYLAEVAIAPHLLVTLGTNAATQVKLNTAATEPIGTAFDEAAAGARIGVERLLDGATKVMIASKAIAAGVRVYGTADGKITDAVVQGAFLVGKAKTAAAADGDEIEVYPLSPVVNP